MRSLLTKSLCVATMCALIAPLQLRADDIPSEKRLPPNVLMHVSVPDFPDLQMRMKDTSMGSMIADPEFDEFRSQLMEKFNEMSVKAEEELGFPLSDLESLLAGEISISVARPIGQSLGIVSTLDIGDHKDVLDQLLAKIDEELKVKTLRRKPIQSTELRSRSIPSRIPTRNRTHPQ